MTKMAYIPSIAILMTVHNRKVETLRCLSKIYSQTANIKHSLSIFMTDDGCTDGTPEAVKEKYQEVRIIKGDGNLFWNRGMLKAWEAAVKENQFDYYLWLNDDTLIINEAIDELLAAANKTNNKTIIIGATYSCNKKSVTYGGYTKNGIIPPESDKLNKVYHFNGNIVLIPNYVYHKIGMLDPYFSHSKGDFDYGMRATKLGIEIYQVGKYLGFCDKHPNLDQWCDPNIPLTIRWKKLHLPNGMPPHETFYLNRRHYGLFSAIIHYYSIYLRCLLPSLWYKRSRKYLQ